MNNFKIIYHYITKKIFFRIFYFFKLFPVFLFIGCTINPATGNKELNLITASEENSIGKNEHPKVLKEFGGIYKNESLQNYVKSLGNFIVKTSEMPNMNFKFTILDSPIVNAFALPGGYIYLTRGLIALCHNEAQLAGVIAHEIGHVTARHAARRYTKSIGTGLLANILGTLSKNYLVRDLIGKSASLYLLSFSREQEYEADMLSVRYMIRAGFDPKEMSNFLKSMEKYSYLQKKMTNSDYKVSELLQTHPTSSKRVAEVISLSEDRIPINPIIGEEIFLKKIDGMTFGDSEKDGFFHKGKFFHKNLKISFEFDDDFFFYNYPNFLIGKADDDTVVVFDMIKDIKNFDKAFLSNWGKVSESKILNFEKTIINDLSTIIGLIEKGNKTSRLVAFKDKDFIFRFALISKKSEFKKFDSKFKKIILSFKRLDEMRSRNISSPKIKIISFSPESEQIEEILSNLNLQKRFSKEKFEILNDLEKKKGKKFFKLKTIY